MARNTPLEPGETNIGPTCIPARASLPSATNDDDASRPVGGSPQHEFILFSMATMMTMGPNHAKNDGGGAEHNGGGGSTESSHQKRTVVVVVVVATPNHHPHGDNGSIDTTAKRIIYYLHQSGQ
jgi:hypothetical protein